MAGQAREVVKEVGKTGDRAGEGVCCEGERGDANWLGEIKMEVGGFYYESWFLLFVPFVSLFPFFN